MVNKKTWGQRLSLRQRYTLLLSKIVYYRHLLEISSEMRMYRSDNSERTVQYKSAREFVMQLFWPEPPNLWHQLWIPAISNYVSASLEIFWFLSARLRVGRFGHMKQALTLPSVMSCQTFWACNWYFSEFIEQLGFHRSQILLWERKGTLWPLLLNLILAL